MARSQPKSLYKNETKKPRLVSQDPCLLALLTSTSDLIIHLDESYRVLAFNKPAGRYYGWSPANVLGKNYQVLCQDSGFRFFIPNKASQKWSIQGRIKTKSTIQHKDGSKHTAFWTISRLLDSKMRHLGFLLVGKSLLDITDLKNIQAALKKEKITNRAKSNFLATISHELRTPLNGILGSVQILMKRSHLSEQYENLKDIYQSGSNLLALVNDILDFSKLEAGKLDFSFEVFNFKDLAEDIIAKMAYQLDSKKEVKLLLNYSNDAPNFVIGDELRIRQILVNLIGNAIKFTEKGAIKVFVKCKSTKAGKANFLITIQDTGIGIPQNKLEKIFERFSQVDSQYSRKYGGAGLGLAICYQMVNAMGGKIGARSALGKGSEFWVQLSFSLPKDSTLANKLLHRDRLPHESLAKVSGYVLLVEDNLLNQKIAKVMLEELGCKVDMAGTGMEAIKQVQTNDYELIFMDISLPDMDGIAVTQKLRAEKYNELPIIALTAHALEEEKAKFLRAGMNDIVVKPISQTQLSDILMRYLVHNK